MKPVKNTPDSAAEHATQQFNISAAGISDLVVFNERMSKARSGQPPQDSKPLQEMSTNVTHTNHALKRPNNPASAKLDRAAAEPERFSDKLSNCKSFFKELLASNVC